MLKLSAVMVLFVAGACASGSNAGTSGDAAPQAPAEQPASEPAAAESEIRVVIDQTPMPIEGHAFSFGVRSVPEGYALREMQWVSERTNVAASTADAISNGQTGEEGFYISGNGQMMGFFYPDERVGETGEVVFLFANEKGEEAAWKKEITLK
ncbi:hypothetical protein [Paenibacillus sp.]|uniref:hypothetical protein n=1 Tax=Paenibacillus sp. TaxID=58172 RepID=UPI002811562E|nr:hypothetical protein [Paenibacillus sp.]